MPRSISHVTLQTYTASAPTSPTFGDLLKQLRKRAGITQGKLGALVGLSLAHISHLEKNQRLPDVQAITEKFIAALALQDEPRTAMRLIELAAVARGERPPTSIILTRETQQMVTDETGDSHATLPTSLTALIGRERSVGVACQRLLDPYGRLLTLMGPPGVGKTRLGMEVAARLQALFADGCYFVTLAAVTAAPSVQREAIVNALALHLGLSEMIKPSKPPRTRLIEFLRRKELLLVLDQFEHLMAGVSLVTDLLTECPGLRVLITSREPLRVRAERRLPRPTA